MYNLNDNQGKKILDLLSAGQPENDKFIFFIGGKFGVGKTELINNLAEKNYSNLYSDIIIKFNYNQQYYFFPDFLKNANISILDDYQKKQFAFEELNYFYETFYENFTHLQSLNEDIYNNYLNIHKLKSIPEFRITQKDAGNSESQLKDFIKSNIEKKGYQRILLNYFEVATESLIMDLLTLFFLSSESSELKDIQVGGEKKTLTLIFDNYDSVAGTINNWIIEYLTDYFTKKKFSDFISYSINFENADVRVGELFDLKLIISGRFVNEEFVQNLKPDLRASSEYDELSYFNESSLRTFLEKEFNELKEKSEEIYKLSKGCPSLVFFITKHYSRFKKIPDRNDVLNNAIHQIFINTPENFKKCVIVASFVDKFEKTYFRCFGETRDDVDLYYDFVRNSSDFFTFEDDKKIIITDAITASFVKEYINYNFPQLYENYQSISNIYRDCFEIIKIFSYEEIKILRSLAYFHNFEFEFILKEIYQEDTENVINFIKNNRSLFIENNHIWTLNQDLKSKLDQLNKIIDGENYPIKFESIEKIKKTLISNINEEKREKTNLISSLTTDIKIIEDCISSDKANFENTQKSFIEKENELIELRKQLNVFTTNRYYTNSVLNFIFAIMIAALSFFFPDIFSSPENHSSLFMVQFILYFVVIVFGILSLYNLYQGLKLASKNKQKFEINTKLINAEQERSNLQEQMTRLKENQEINKNLLAEKKEQLELLKKRLFDINKFLNISELRIKN